MEHLNIDRFKNYFFSEVLHNGPGISLLAVANLDTSKVVYKITADGSGVIAEFDTLLDAVKGFNELSARI